jgi:signal transduction histidine kinase
MTPPKTNEQIDARIDTGAPLTPERDMPAVFQRPGALPTELPVDEAVDPLTQWSQSLGQFGRGLVHKLRGRLCAVTGGLEIGLRDLPPRKAQAFELAHRSALGLRDILDDILLLTQPPSLAFGFHDVNRLMADLATDVRRKWNRPAHRLEERYQPGLPALRVDDIRLASAVAAALQNAAEALSPEGGLVTLETSWNAARRSVEIRVTDNGRGLTPEARRSAFEPYFSSKRDGRGLGLSLARWTLQLHGGHVTLADRPGGGAVARFLLPVPGQRRATDAALVPPS